jgi:hypothetical protein
MLGAKITHTTELVTFHSVGMSLLVQGHRHRSHVGDPFKWCTLQNSNCEIEIVFKYSWIIAELWARKGGINEMVIRVWCSIVLGNREARQEQKAQDH